MAEIYSQIKTLRQSVYSNQTTVVKALNTALSSGQCMAAVSLSSNAATLSKVMLAADTALCNAYQNAAAMVEVTAKLSPSKYTVSTTVKKNSTIKLDYTALESSRNQLLTAYSNLSQNLTTCTKLISLLNSAQWKETSNKTTSTVASIAGGLAGTAASKALSVSGSASTSSNSITQILKRNAFNASKGLAITLLTTAKKNLNSLCTKIKALTDSFSKVINAFKTAESNLSKFIANRKKSAVLAKSSAYTKATSSNASEIKSCISELEAVQKEYVAAYGKESEEIAEEIARLKKLLPGTALAEIMALAVKSKSQGGEVGKTRSDYGFTGSWCDAFVIYMLKKAGLIDLANALTKDSTECCQTHVNNIKANNLGTWISKSELDSYTPKTGDLVYFGPSESSVGHAGIIYVDEKGVTYVLHGNFGKSPQVCLSQWNPAIYSDSWVTVGGYTVQPGNLKTATIGICSLS